jgi:enoyl-CoA hydratase/carnithine racemase
LRSGIQLVILFRQIHLSAAHQELDRPCHQPPTRRLRESAGWPLGEEFERQRAYLEPVFASEDAAEGIAAFRERRDPKWQDR